jgi:choline dehydrogenase-like flavoprotein
MEDDVIKAADEATGFSKKPTDPWSGDHIGFYNTLGSVVRTGPNKGKRSYAARGYYEANKERPNLKVLCESLVNRVVLDGNKATGVSFSHNGSDHEVKAKREVIVSGGTIKTPQILELSGVGDPEVLRKAGVECKVENIGIGAHVQDHVVTAVAYSMQPGEMSLDSISIPEVMAMAQKELMENQSGPLTCVSGVQGFFPYKLMATPEELKECVESIRKTPARSDFERKQFDQIIAHLESDTSANLQMVLVAALGNFKEGTQDQAKLFPLTLSENKEAGFTLALCLQYPVSRGTIHISSSGTSYFSYSHVDS